MTDVADSSRLVPCQPFEGLVIDNSNAISSFQTIMRKRKLRTCDLLHKGLRRPALNRQNGSENPPIIACRPLRHRHRLCVDRHSCWCHCSRAALPHPALTAAPPDRPANQTEYAGAKIRFISSQSFVRARLFRVGRQIASSAKATNLAAFPTSIVGIVHKVS
jgi:hypothetical protein